MPRTAVVLFNMGGPDELPAVEPFLYNLFADPDIIQIPWWMGGSLLQKPLARFISRRRAPDVSHHYQMMGGKSPLIEITASQAAALEAWLEQRFPDEYRCLVAMRYWKPFTSDALDEVQRGGFERVILLSLYPHYSRATTLSSMNDWITRFDNRGMRIPVQIICSYSGHPAYIELLARRIGERIEQAVQQTPRERVMVLFSAHGLPQRYVNQGDPYRDQIERTAKAVMERLGHPYMLSFQSRVGPETWLLPGTEPAMAWLRERGYEALVVVPVSFVSEHIETLYEIEVQFGEEARRLGFTQFLRVPTPNADADFVELLGDLVVQKERSCSSAMWCDAPPEMCCGLNRGPQGAWKINRWLANQPRVLTPGTSGEQPEVSPQ